MLRCRLALGVFAAAIALLPLTSAWAFSQQTAGGGDGNSSFADPDDQITNSFGVRPLDFERAVDAARCAAARYI